jgi:hypothetical protein
MVEPKIMATFLEQTWTHGTSTSFTPHTVTQAQGTCPSWADVPSLANYKMVVAKIVKPDNTEILFPTEAVAETYLALLPKASGFH